MEDIIYFNIDDIKYSIKKDNNKLLFYRNMEIINNEEDKKLINLVLNKITNVSDIVKLPTINIDDKNIFHYFSTLNGLHLFYYKDDNLIKPVDKDLRIKLNCLFNNQEMPLINETFNNMEKYFKKIIKVNGKSIVAFISSAVIFLSPGLNTAFAQVETDDVLNLNLVESVEISKNDLNEMTAELKYKYIENAINCNIYLTLDEKQFFLSQPQFFIDQAKYMDINYVLESLMNLKVVYKSEFDNNCYGIYDNVGENKNQINIYNSTNFDDCDKSILSHEFLHVFTNYGDYQYGVGLAEPINVMFNNEYFGNCNNGYDQFYQNGRKYLKLLIEILGKECICEYHANANPNIIINRLMDIIPDNTKAVNIVASMDYVVWNKDGDNLDSAMYQEIVSDFLDDLNDYYKMVNNKEINEDLYLSYFFDKNAFSNELSNSYNLDSQTKEILIKNTTLKKDKIYFNTVNETDEYVINFPTSTANEYNYLTFDELIKYDEKYNYIGIPFAKTSDNKYIVPIGADYVDLTINSYINNLGR